jgi:hypothetical protein
VIKRQRIILVIFDSGWMSEEDYIGGFLADG